MRGFISPINGSDLSCERCPVGLSTIADGDTNCVPLHPVSVMTEKRCTGYSTLKHMFPTLNIELKYMNKSVEKMLLFTGVTGNFFNLVGTVEAEAMISYPKKLLPTQSFHVLVKGKSYYDTKYLLDVPPYIDGMSSFALSWPSCVEHNLKPGEIINKIRLMFFSVSPEEMLTADTIVGCRDIFLDGPILSNNKGLC